jgi:hypothetical protein
MLLHHLSNLTKLDPVDHIVIESLTILTKLQSLNLFMKADIILLGLFDSAKFPTTLTSLAANLGPLGPIHLDIDMVARLTRLKSLRWTAERHGFPHSLLPNLESLELLGSPSNRLGLNTNLTHLELRSIPNRIDALTGLIKLRSLNIYYGPDIPLSYLAALTDLEQLRIQRSFSDEFNMDLICSYLTTTKLTHLYCHCQCTKISDEILRLTALQELSVGHGSQIGWLTYLKILTSLESSYGIDSNYVYITRLTKLKRLHLYFTHAAYGGIHLMDLTFGNASSEHGFNL